MSIKKEAKIITKITILAIAFNAILLAVKLSFGVLGKSMAVVNGAIDSGLDVIATITILFVGRYSRKKEDKSHPYGHEKFESIIAIILGIMMIVVAAQLVISGVTTLVNFFQNKAEITKPEILAIVAAAVTIIIKLGLFIVTVRSYKKAKSPALKALAVDHVSDVIVTVALLVGVVLAMAGFLYFEPIAGILIAIFIAYNGFNIIRENIGQVVDEAAESEVINEIRKTANSVNGVLRVDKLKTRKFGLKLYVDIEIAVDANLTVKSGHDIAEEVHDLIESEFDEVKHCMVHVNPYKEKLT